MNEWTMSHRWRTTCYATNKLVLKPNQITFFLWRPIWFWHLHRHYLIRDKINEFGGKLRVQTKLIVVKSELSAFGSVCNRITVQSAKVNTIIWWKRNKRAGTLLWSLCPPRNRETVPVCAIPLCHCVRDFQFLWDELKRAWECVSHFDCSCWVRPSPSCVCVRCRGVCVCVRERACKWVSEY